MVPESYTKDEYLKHSFVQDWGVFGIPRYGKLKHKAYRLSGFSEIDTNHFSFEFWLSEPQSLPVLIPIASFVVKSIVEAAVWEWIGGWLIVTAIINTLFFF
jgi:hypothetical protein